MLIINGLTKVALPSLVISLVNLVKYTVNIDHKKISTYEHIFILFHPYELNDAVFECK